MIVLLDTSILGLVASPSQKGEAKLCKRWLYQLLARSAYVVTSDLCDYEVRRGLLLASLRHPSVEGLNNLNELSNILDFLPLTPSVMKCAAQLWAESRYLGQPTADEKNIDGDVIIAAQWQLLKEEYRGQYIVIATTNVKHLQRFAEAKTWQEIRF